MDSTTLLSKLIVLFMLLVELQTIQTMYASSVLEGVADIGYGSAVDSRGPAVRRRDTTKDNDTNSFEFLITGGYRPEDKSLLQYVVSIQVDVGDVVFGGNHKCAGTIISKRNILTAAHCTYVKRRRVALSRLSVVIGTPKRLEKVATTQIFEVENVRMHERYSKNKYPYDIAILTLNNDIIIDGKSSGIVELADGKPSPGTTCTTLGWGAIIEWGPAPNEAIWADLTIKKKAVCKSFGITELDVFCAKNEQDYGTDICSGDSGGPLICNNKLVGMTIYVMFGCGNKNSMTAFLDVYHYRNWIELSNEGACVRFFLVPFQLVLAATAINNCIWHLRDD